MRRSVCVFCAVVAIILLFYLVAEEPFTKNIDYISRTDNESFTIENTFEPYWKGINISENNFLYKERENNPIFSVQVNKLQYLILEEYAKNQLSNFNYTEIIDPFLPFIGINGIFDALEQGLLTYLYM